jgi:chromosome segregation protein
VKKGFEEIAEALLGHVVVAPDIDAAIERFNQNGKFQSIVTKNGDIVSHQGAMIGGSKEKLAGILTKKREIKGLEKEINRYNSKIEDGQVKQEEMESEVRELEINLQKLIQEKNDVAEKEIAGEKTFYKTTEDLKLANRHLEIIRLEQEQLLGEETDIDAQMDEYNKVITEIENNIQTASEKVNANAAEVDRLSKAMDQYNQKIVDQKLEMTSLRAKLENCNNTLNRLIEFQKDGLQRFEQLTIEISQKNQKRISCATKIEEMEKRLSEMYEEIKLLEQTLERNEADYQIIDSELKDNDKIISDIKGNREKTLEKLRLLELEQSQKRLTVENIINRLEERYNDSFEAIQSELKEMEKDFDLSLDEMNQELDRCKNKVARIHDVNLGAIKEYEQLKERFDFLCEQREDLISAVEDLHKVINKINKITQIKFIETFEKVNHKLKEVFPKLFEGGTAKLMLTDPNNPLETGVEFMVHPPGKKLTRLSLLSGGEKALSAIAFIFAIFLIKPASFCLMDEIDAPLDEANIYRFNELLKIIGEKSQVLMITHNKKSMEFADTLFGITMEQKGISKIVSVNFN